MHNDIALFKNILNTIKQNNFNNLCNFMIISNMFPGHFYEYDTIHFSIAHSILNKPNYNSKTNKFVFDIETNNAYDKKIVQFAYYVLNDKNTVIEANSFYVYNEKVYTDFYKKIKYHTLRRYGLCPIILHHKLHHVLSHCDTLIGHNIKIFDCKVITKYFSRFGLEINISDKKFVDTMTESKHLLNLKNIKGRLKNPSLTELSNFFNISSQNECFHDALYDVDITYKCYIHLQNVCL